MASRKDFVNKNLGKLLNAADNNILAAELRTDNCTSREFVIVHLMNLERFRVDVTGYKCIDIAFAVIRDMRKR